MHDEGVIKFKANWTEAAFEVNQKINSLIEARNDCRTRNWIGESNGLGYGNISIRTSEGFIISASQTGEKRVADKDDFSMVSNWNFENNSLDCLGVKPASSESLSHAAVYHSISEVNAVIHAHHEKWKDLLNKVPTTATVPYGTIQMVDSIQDLIKKEGLKAPGIIAMAGHPGGIIAFGTNLDSCLDTLSKHLDK